VESEAKDGSKKKDLLFADEEHAVLSDCGSIRVQGAARICHQMEIADGLRALLRLCERFLNSAFQDPFSMFEKDIQES
jgi:hypothetical protein